MGEAIDRLEVKLADRHVRDASFWHEPVGALIVDTRGKKNSLRGGGALGHSPGRMLARVAKFNHLYQALNEQPRSGPPNFPEEDWEYDDIKKSIDREYERNVARDKVRQAVAGPAIMHRGQMGHLSDTQVADAESRLGSSVARGNVGATTGYVQALWERLDRDQSVTGRHGAPATSDPSAHVAQHTPGRAEAESAAAVAERTAATYDRVSHRSGNVGTVQDLAWQAAQDHTVAANLFKAIGDAGKESYHRDQAHGLYSDYDLLDENPQALGFDRYGRYHEEW